MAKIINISDKLSNEKTSLQVNGRNYEINDSIAVVMKFEELAANGTASGMMEALKLVLGEESFNKLNVKGMSLKNLKVVFTAILAATQDISYEEAEERFRK